MKFYPRVVNNTNIILSKDEMILLNKGLKYNLHFKRKNWLHTLALEAGAAISFLPTNEQEDMRHLIAKQIQQLHRRQTREHTRNTPHAKHEKHIISAIRTKLKNNNAMIMKADRGNSIVVIQNKRRGKLSSKVLFFHDNACPPARELLDHFGWEVFDRPPYSPDLALNDYHLFPNMKT
jgi:hypothetical protein